MRPGREGGSCAMVVQRAPLVSRLAAARPQGPSRARRGVAARAEEGETTVQLVGGGEYPVLRTEDLKRGTRRVVTKNGVEVLLVWFGGEVYAVQNRAPSEGSFSEGLMNAQQTSDGGITCPQTGSVFSVKTGEVMEWFPGNPVMGALTPKASLMTYPVRIEGSDIFVDVPSSGKDDGYVDVSLVIDGTAKGKGGIMTDQVQVIEPQVRLVEVGEPGGSQAGATLAIVFAFVAIGVTAAVIAGQAP